MNIPQEFVERYNRPGPRYTSYPTVPVWDTEFGEDDYRDALTDLNGLPDDELAIYLHLPFCAKACHFCGCNMIIDHGKSAVDIYLDRVEKELGRVLDIIGTDRKVSQFHWGGGTPNFLNEKETERTLQMFRDAFDILPGAEVSLEVDPRIATAEQVAFFKDVGFNRISLGVQDFSVATQKAIGRNQSRERTLAVYQGCRDAGFAGVNLDLVYGLPGQTRESFESTLTEIIGLQPDRVACFSYAHVPWVRPNQEMVDTTIMLEGYDKFQLFMLTVDLFKDADYTWIGIDHFAKKSDELSVALENKALHRNFMGYATKPAPHMLAFGMSGIGDVCGRFVQNASTMTPWEEAVDAGKMPIIKGMKLDDDDKMRREMILNLMCNLVLPWSSTEKAWGRPADQILAASLPALDPLIADGLCVVDDYGLHITDKGRYFVRNVAMTMDAYLGDGAKAMAKKSNVTYSKTV